MNYQVAWMPDALDNMGAMISAHPDHKELFATTLRTLSEALRTAPGDFGESREGNERIGFVGPLVVIVRVLHADRLVRVLSVSQRTLLL